MLRVEGSEKEYFIPSSRRTTVASWVTMVHDDIGGQALGAVGEPL